MCARGKVNGSTSPHENLSRLKGYIALEQARYTEAISIFYESLKVCRFVESLSMRFDFPLLTLRKR